MAIQNTSFAKGEAVQKLIEVIARVNNKSVADDTALQVAINEVREMFKTDEMTECTMAELNEMVSGSQLEPGHKYKITDNDNIIVSAKSASALEGYAVGDSGIYKVIYEDPAGYSFELVENFHTNVLYRNISTDYTLKPEDFECGKLVLNLQIVSGIRIICPIQLFIGKEGFALELVGLTPSTEVEIVQQSANGQPISQMTHIINGHKTLIWTSNSWLWTQGQSASSTDDFIGSNTVSSVENIPVNKSTVVATLADWSDKPLPVSFAEGLPEGREVYVIAQNASTDPLTLSFTGANVETVDFAPFQRIEFSVINIAGTYYVRVGVDVEATGGTDVEEITAEEVAAMFN